jgi:hypothetical protein
MSGNVSFSRPVATFATCFRGWKVGSGDALEMSILVKPKPHVRVTSLANHAPHELPSDLGCVSDHSRAQGRINQQNNCKTASWKKTKWEPAGQI